MGKPTIRNLRPGQTAIYATDKDKQFEVVAQADGTLRVQSTYCHTRVIAERDPTFGHLTLRIERTR